MATVTWLGVEGEPDVEETGMRHYVFKKGEAVEVDDPHVLMKCASNPYFKVSGYEEPMPRDDSGTTYRAVAATSAQGPVPKPGDPLNPAAETVDRPKWPKV